MAGKPKIIRIDFSEVATQELRDLAAKTKFTPTEVVRQALVFYRAMKEENPKRIIIESKYGVFTSLHVLSSSGEPWPKP